MHLDLDRLRNFDDMDKCPCVAPVLVNAGVSEHTETGIVFTDKETYDQYLDTLTLGGKAYGLARGITKYDPNSGITIETMDEYIKYLDTSPDKFKSFIFDWDQTLTVFSGVTIPSTNDLAGVFAQFDLYNLSSYHSVAEYYFGGHERTVKLTEFLGKIQEKRIPIYILSANGSITRAKKFFWDLLNTIGIDIPMEKIQYKGRGNTKFNYLRDEWPQICTT